MKYVEEYSKAIEALHDHIMQRTSFWYNTEETIYSIPGEEWESLIRLYSLRSTVPFINNYVIDISTKCIPHLKASHIKELRKLKLVISNKHVTSSIQLNTRFAGTLKRRKRFEGFYRTPIEFRDCVFEPSSRFSTFPLRKGIEVKNCEILG